MAAAKERAADSTVASQAPSCAEKLGAVDEHFCTLVMVFPTPSVVMEVPLEGIHAPWMAANHTLDDASPLPQCAFTVASLYTRCSCDNVCVLAVVLMTMVAAVCGVISTAVVRKCGRSAEDYEAIAELREQERREQERRAITAVQQLPSMIYCSDATEDCTLCYDAFIKGQVVRQLPCGHVYHCVCIDKWLMRGQRGHEARRCPLCGADPTLSPGSRIKADKVRRGSEGVARLPLGSSPRRHSSPGVLL